MLMADTSLIQQYVSIITDHFCKLLRCLGHPYLKNIRPFIFRLITTLDQTYSVSLSYLDPLHQTFVQASIQYSCKPSIDSQSIEEISPIIDPYVSALSLNYYFPLANSIDQDNMEDNHDSLKQPYWSGKQLSINNTTVNVAVEQSIDIINNLLKEMEEDGVLLKVKTVYLTSSSSSKANGVVLLP